MKNILPTYQSLEQYESVWAEFEGDPLMLEILSEELKNNPKRTIREIKSVVKKRTVLKRTNFLMLEVKAIVGLTLFLVTACLILYIMSK